MLAISDLIDYSLSQFGESNGGDIQRNLLALAIAVGASYWIGKISSTPARETLPPHQEPVSEIELSQLRSEIDGVGQEADLQVRHRKTEGLLQKVFDLFLADLGVRWAQLRLTQEAQKNYCAVDPEKEQAEAVTQPPPPISTAPPRSDEAKPPTAKKVSPPKDNWNAAEGITSSSVSEHEALRLLRRSVLSDPSQTFIAGTKILGLATTHWQGRFEGQIPSSRNYPQGLNLNLTLESLRIRSQNLMARYRLEIRGGDSAWNHSGDGEVGFFLQPVNSTGSYSYVLRLMDGQMYLHLFHNYRLPGFYGNVYQKRKAEWALIGQVALKKAGL